MGVREQRRTPGRRSWRDRPWLQLLAGVVGMVAIANLQYGWTLFVRPLQARFGWGETAIQVAFTLFVLAETWLVPVEGYLVDRFGPRPLVALGGLLVGLAWIVDARAESLGMLYLMGVVGGTGAGVVYGTSIGNALKWFPHRRGLAAGLTSAAFGAGSALTVFPTSQLIAAHGYQAAFLWFGLGQGVVVLLAALVLESPPAEEAPARTASPSASRDCTWREVVRTPLFGLMYVMFTMVTLGGLMAVAQLGPMARDYGVADVPVSLPGLTMAALPLAMAIDRVLNGLTRPFFGWVSDHLGRENTMFLAFALEGAAILLLVHFAHIPALFVLLSGLTFFAWGEIYSIFPALCADLFGRRYATVNYGLLYTAKGTAALLIPLGNMLKEKSGSWMAVFLVAVAFDWVVAVLALVALKPLCRRWLADRASPVHGAEEEGRFHPPLAAASGGYRPET